MSEFLTVLGAVLPVFSIAGAGVFMRKLNWLTEEADQSLLRMTVNLLAPALIFDSILRNEALKQWQNLAIPPLIGFGTVALGIAVAWLVRHWLGTREGKEQRTFAFTVGMYNYGYVPVPLAIFLFDRETVGVLFVHNVGVEIAFWIFGMLMMAGASPRSGWKRLVNMPMAAILVALSLNLLGGYHYVPGFVLTTAHMLGQCAIPIGLILIGAVMADHLGEFHSKSGWRVMIWACVLRLGLLPLAFLALAKFLPLPLELQRVMLLQAAMPSAVFSIVMAKHYQGDPQTAVRVVAATSILALLTIPLWIRAGSKWLGL